MTSVLKPLVVASMPVLVFSGVLLGGSEQSTLANKSNTPAEPATKPAMQQQAGHPIMPMMEPIVQPNLPPEMILQCVDGTRF